MTTELDKYKAALVAKYYELCDQRDAVYAKARPVESALAAQSAVVQAEQAKEAALAAEVEAIWGPNWIALKKEIADIARTLVKIPPRG